jgi:serine/threonine protein phosphatase PrpC
LNGPVGRDRETKLDIPRIEDGNMTAPAGDAGALIDELIIELDGEFEEASTMPSPSSRHDGGDGISDAETEPLEIWGDVPVEDEEGVLTETVISYTMRSGAASEQGTHSRNDDCARAGWWCDCFVVSDGIGGAPDGDYMSRVSCGAVLDSYETEPDILKAFDAGNMAALLVSKWIDNPDCGATLLVAAPENGRMEFAWCGDSVAYRLRDGAMTLLTPADRAGDTNMLVSAIGYDTDLEPLTASSDIKVGDRFLLCTDGVWTVFEQSNRLGELANLLNQGDNAPLIASKICSEARKDGYDDASAVVIIVDGSTMTSRVVPPSNLNEQTPPPAIAEDIFGEGGADAVL